MSDRWSVGATKILICAYQRFDFLYDAHHADYKNRSKRSEAYKEIENVLKANGFQYTTEDVKKKLNGLRSQYLAEKLKIANSMKSGADGDDVYKPTVYWYDMLRFLETGTPAADESISNLDVLNYLELITPHESNTEEMDTSVEHPAVTDAASTSGNSEDESQHRNNKRKMSSNNTDSMFYRSSRSMIEMTQIMKDNQLKKPNQPQSSDSVDNFVKFIGDELRGIRDASGEALLRQVKRKIQLVILQSWDSIDNPPPTPSPSSSFSS